MSTATLWEWRATLDRGFTIDRKTGTSGPFHGHRIRYRKQGTRRWRSFLFERSDGKTPTDTDIIRAIEAHAERHP